MPRSSARVAGNTRPRLPKSQFGVGILGFGVLGQAVAAALAPFAFLIRGWSAARKEVPGVESFAGLSELRAFLASSRVLVCLLPSTRETRDLLDKANLAHLPRGAHLVNVARGDIVVDEDLVALLDEGHLAGATLDVFREEPLPSTHPFWHHPKIALTPHTSAVTVIGDSVAQIAAKDPPARAWGAGDGGCRSVPGLLSAPPNVMTRNAMLPKRFGWSKSGRATACRTKRRMVPTDAKVALIDALAEAGFPAIEATAFVSPKWVPQMADAADVMRRIRRKPGVRYPVLDAQHEGLRRGARRAAPTRSRCSSPLRRRSRARTSIAASKRAWSARGRSSRRRRPTASGCAATFRACSAARTRATSMPDRVAEVAERALRVGQRTRCRSATPSASGTAGKTAALFERSAQRVPVDALAGHFHDTYGQALTNVYAAMETGVATFDCSVAGLGGCPYAKGATGNVASEDVVYLHGRARHRNGRRSHAAPRGGTANLGCPRASARVARRARARGERAQSRHERSNVRATRHTRPRAVALHQRVRAGRRRRPVHGLFPHARRDRRVGHARCRRQAPRAGRASRAQGRARRAQ